MAGLDLQPGSLRARTALCPDTALLVEFSFLFPAQYPAFHLLVKTLPSRALGA